MNAERWRQIEALYLAALERPSQERGTFVADACEGDHDLYRELQSLLAQDPAADSPLDTPVWEHASDMLGLQDLPNLRPGAQVGVYKIESLIGSGGMGCVYRATDTRLNRAVAIKFCAQRFSSRFAREAQAIARLNHPHICTVHDVGPNYLVMEYVEGETLAARLSNRAFSFSEALPLAIQIADALEAAHRKGVVHRDLKPANIMLTRIGIKLVDFGLARISRCTQDGDTASAGATNPGTILGTLQYMAPEQLEGKEADARTDLFAFGMVYEMLTGRKAFDATSQAGLISAIMSADPPAITTVQPLVPPRLERVVKTCLSKDPDSRWQSARDIQLELSWLQEETGLPVAKAKPRNRERLAWGIALLLLAATSVLVLNRFTTMRPQIHQSIRSSILPPSNYSFEPGSFSLSPDGMRLAFVALGPDGTDTLWVRSLSTGDAQQMNGTEGAMLPFWAPESRRIGFFAAGKLNTVDLTSGAVRILCEAPFGRCGGTWGPDGTIVFAPSVSGPLYRIPEAGGVPVPVTHIIHPNRGNRHLWPSFLPDGTHFLYSESSGPLIAAGETIYIGSLDGSVPKLALSNVSANVSYTSGYLLYGRDHRLWAQPFDPRRLELRGPPRSIVTQELDQDRAFSRSDFSASQNGVLVFQSLADSGPRLTWFDSKGQELGELKQAGLMDPRLSRDGRFVAMSSDDAHNGRFFIRVYDLARGFSARVTDGGTDRSPGWTPDGKRITYSASEGESQFVKDVSADGSSPPQVLVKGAAFMGHPDWSRDGHLVFSDFSTGIPSLKLYSAEDHSVRSLGPGGEARFSPDGKWIAYVGSPTMADSDGIFVQSFPSRGERIRISVGSGAQPGWAQDGKQIFYVAPDRKLMAADFDPDKRVAGIPRVLFQTRIVSPNFADTQYAAAAGGRFLINSLPADHSSPLTLISGWVAALNSEHK